MGVRWPLADGILSTWALTQLDHGVDAGTVIALALVALGDLVVDGHAELPDLVALLTRDEREY
jgi:hypothetical protein